MVADRPTGRRSRLGLVRVLLACVAAIWVGACQYVPGTLDGPIAVDLHVSTTATSVEVDAPGWFADTSEVYLCPVEPPPLPDPGPELVGWQPGPPCHGFGRWPSPDGLRASLPYDGLAVDERDLFAAAESWYLLLLDVGADGRVSSAVRSRFDVPEAVTSP